MYRKNSDLKRRFEGLKKVKKVKVVVKVKPVVKRIVKKV